MKSLPTAIFLSLVLLSGCGYSETSAIEPAPTEVLETADELERPVAIQPTPTTQILPNGWSPIGEQSIVFSSNETGDNEIYVVNKDGTELIQVTHLPMSDEIFPKWSPDGTMLTFLTRIAQEDGSYAESIMTISLDGTILGSVDGADCNRVGGPFWSPDSRWVTVYCWENVWFFHPDGSDKHTIGGTDWGDPGLIHWSPNSQLLGVRNGDSFQISDLNENVIDIETDWIGRRSAADTAYDFDFYPNGASLVYVMASAENGADMMIEIGPAVIMKVNLATLDYEQVSPAGSELDFYMPQFISDDHFLVYGRGREDYSVDGLFDLNPATHEVIEILPAAESNGYSLSPSKKRLAYLANSELRVMDLERHVSDYVLTDGYFESFATILWFPNEDGLLLYKSTSVKNISLQVIDLQQGTQTKLDIPATSTISVDVR